MGDGRGTRREAGESHVENLLYVVLGVVAVTAILTYGHTVYRLFDHTVACYGSITCAASVPGPAVAVDGSHATH